MNILNELEKMLREAAQQQGMQVPPSRRPPPDREIIEAVDAEVIEAEPVYESMSAHVADDIDTSDITQRASRFRDHASRLGAEVGQADDKLQERLHEKFDRDLGRIHGDTVTDDTGVGRPGGVPSTATEIVEVFRNPKSIRQAIILNEILKRPEHRW
jgi:hypothetical protein